MAGMKLHGVEPRLPGPDGPADEIPDDLTDLRGGKLLWNLPGHGTGNGRRRHGDGPGKRGRNLPSQVAQLDGDLAPVPVDGVCSARSCGRNRSSDTFR